MPIELLSVGQFREQFSCKIQVRSKSYIILFFLLLLLLSLKNEIFNGDNIEDNDAIEESSVHNESHRILVAIRLQLVWIRLFAN